MEILIICDINFKKENGLLSVYNSLIQELDLADNITTINFRNGSVFFNNSEDIILIDTKPLSYFDFLKFRLPHYMFKSQKLDNQTYNNYILKSDKIFFIGSQTTYNLISQIETNSKVTYIQTDSHLNYYEKRLKNKIFNFWLFNNILKPFIINYEIRLYEKISEIVFVSDDDVKVQKYHHIKNYNFKTLSLKINKPHYFHSPKKKLVNANVVFFGDFNYKPNYEAAIFINDLAKSEELKNFNFNLIGDGMGFLKLNKNVNYLGYVDDLDLRLKDMDIFISPIFSGAGMKNKVLKAFSIGLPSIITNESLTGLNKEILSNFCLIANSNLEFINNLQLLSGDFNLRKSFSTFSIDFIKKY
jgi:glycosyltransferase involved in cell wall biosynthesis